MLERAWRELLLLLVAGGHEGRKRFRLGGDSVGKSGYASEIDNVRTMLEIVAEGERREMVITLTFLVYLMLKCRATSKLQ